WVQLEMLLDEGDQTIQSLPHICIPADDVDVLCLTDVSQHLRPVLSPGWPDSLPAYPLADGYGCSRCSARSLLHIPQMQHSPETYLHSPAKPVPAVLPVLVRSPALPEVPRPVLPEAVFANACRSNISHRSPCTIPVCSFHSGRIAAQTAGISAFSSSHMRF